MSFTFSFSTLLNLGHLDVTEYLSKPESLKRMAPPWTRLNWKVVQTTGQSEKEKGVSYRSRWNFFYDIKITRTIVEVSSHKTELLDDIKLMPRFGYLSKVFSEKKIQDKVRKVLEYQYKNFQEDLVRYEKHKGSSSLSVVISGSSGFVGSFLKLMLKLFGYHVKTLVRRKPRSEEEIFWDPYCELIDKRSLEGLYAVINLTGENLFSLRWTKKKKQKILDSRIRSTKYLAETLNKLEHPPKLFFSASAVGIYGDQGNTELTETSKKGRGFLADVAVSWEEMAKIFTRGKCIQMRFGVVLSARGGMLKKLLPAFRYGLGAILGSGKEYLSWIALEDLAYQLLFLLKNRELEGPYNFCSEYSLTQQQLALELGKALHKSVWMRLPRWLLYVMLGEMSSLIVSSTCTKPKKLLELGAKFAYPNFSETLKHNIGL